LRNVEEPVFDLLTEMPKLSDEVYEGRLKKF